MKKLLCWAMVVPMLSAALCLTACGGDDDKDPNGNGGGSVPDPEGTVLVQVLHDEKTWISIEEFEWFDGWKNTYFGSIALNSANNIYVDSYQDPSGEIVSVGKVHGLGNITDLPKTGWSRKTAAMPGYGYVLRFHGNYCRVYVVDYIKSTGGGIIGATIKYQSPFVPENLSAGE